MTKGELIDKMKDMPDDAPVYLSTGSSMDNLVGDHYEVENVWTEFKTFGLLLPKALQSTVECIILEA